MWDDVPGHDTFYAGVMFGMESARDELATALASAIKDGAKHDPLT